MVLITKTARKLSGEPVYTDKDSDELASVYSQSYSQTTSLEAV